MYECLPPNTIKTRHKFDIIRRNSISEMFTQPKYPKSVVPVTQISETLSVGKHKKPREWWHFCGRLRLFHKKEERQTWKQVAKLLSLCHHIVCAFSVTNRIPGKLVGKGLEIDFLPDSRSADSCWRSVHSSGSAGVDVESVLTMVGSSCRLANLIRRFRQVESTKVSSNRSRSHPASNCSQESLQSLRRCCFLPLSLLWRQRLRLPLIYFLPDLFCYPKVAKCRDEVSKWHLTKVVDGVGFLCLHSNHWYQPIARLLPVTSCPAHYRYCWSTVGGCIHLGFDIFS
jgi:hypothetical protein